MSSLVIVDSQATVPLAVLPPASSDASTWLCATHLFEPRGLMMSVPLLMGEKGAAQSLRRVEAQVVIRAHPRTPPRRSTAKKSVSSFHTW